MINLLVIILTFPPVEYKSLSIARLYSAVIPGAGQFYVENYLKGIMDLSIVGIGAGTTYFLYGKIKEAPQKREKEGELTKTDYAVLTGICGISTFIYYIYQIWRLNDDVVVYNYKKAFLGSSYFRINLHKDRFTLLIAKNF